MLDTKMVRYYELVTNIVYDDSQDILVPGSYSALGNTRICLHFNCSFMQLKQQTSGHNNIPLLGVCRYQTCMNNMSQGCFCRTDTDSICSSVSDLLPKCFVAFLGRDLDQIDVITQNITVCNFPTNIYAKSSSKHPAFLFECFYDSSQV